MHLLKYHWPRRARTAFLNRQEIIRARLSRRELFRMGLITGTGFLVLKNGLSAWADCNEGECELGCSPPTIPFVDPLPFPPVLPTRDPATYPAFTFSPPDPSGAPNRNTNPATGIPFEGRTQTHQFRTRFPVQEFLATRMRPNFDARFSDNATNLARIGPQLVWGFNLGGSESFDVALSPGPLIVARYGRPILVRRFNELGTRTAMGCGPGNVTADTRGFGVPEVSTHLHNFHSGPDSDGGPCDPGTGGNSTDPCEQGRFFFVDQFYDYYHTMRPAGFDTPQFSATNGDVRETLTTLWYHDHRVDHTAENVYKGLAGQFFAFNDFDTGEETTGFHLPSFNPYPAFDLPLIFADKLFTPEGELCFDTFGLDGLVGDKFLVNGKMQPYFDVQKRRYRFRLQNAGPSRFYQFFLTNPSQPSVKIPYWAITTTDGNLLSRPVEISGSSSQSPHGVRLSVAERVDVIIDFKRIWQMFGSPSGTLKIWLENRLEQVNGRAPTDKVLPPGNVSNALVEFRISGGAVTDTSFDPQPVAFPNVGCSASDCVFSPICLPPVPTDNAPAPEDRIRITRTFRFERGNGAWQINGQFVDCTRFRFAVERNTAERWILQNNSGGWQHPIHIHLEEFRMVRRNNKLIQCGDVEFGRKDVARLGFNEEIELLFRFRDFRGGWPMHCHNTVHEDHAMMLLFEVADTGDNKTQP
jgi:FtsP/CotA-like multicopper oxidase with cupredoxin domain